MKSKKVKIGYKEYEIIKKNEVIELPSECYGKINYDRETIEISTKFSQKQQKQTLIHQIKKGIIEKLDIYELEKDEKVVNQLSKELYMLIIDNPHIFTMKDI